MQFGFPDTVDEISARLVAAGVVSMTVVAIAFDQPWLTVVLAYGFAARVAAGPRYSPLALVATRVIRPRIDVPPRFVQGPPKRFAQAMGLGFSTVALGLWIAGSSAWPFVLALLAVAATLESAVNLCLGCKVYGICPMPVHRAMGERLGP
jgi:hypothetical protein